MALNIADLAEHAIDAVPDRVALICGDEKLTYAQLEASQNNPQLFGYQPTGAAGFTAGWDKVAFKPALNARQAMRFDYGRENRTVAAIEVGVTEEYYASDINLMYGINGTHFFFNSYVAILFGGRK